MEGQIGCNPIAHRECLDALTQLISLVFYGACAPSMGKAGAAQDDTAIVTLLYDSRSKIHYVLDADIRKRRPDDIVEAIIALHAIRRYSSFGVETVQFQEVLKDELVRRAADRGRSLSVKGIRTRRTRSAASRRSRR